MMALAPAIIAAVGQRSAIAYSSDDPSECPTDQRAALMAATATV